MKRLILVAMALANAGAARAGDPLFTPPGDPVVSPAHIDFGPTERFLGEDAAGYVYVQTGVTLDCYRPSDPASRRSISNATYPGVVLFSPDRTSVDLVHVPNTFNNGPTGNKLHIWRITCADMARDAVACREGQTCTNGTCPAVAVAGVGNCLSETFREAPCAAAGGEVVADPFCFPADVPEKLACAESAGDACSPGYADFDASCASGFACFQNVSHDGARCTEACGQPPKLMVELDPMDSPLTAGEECNVGPQHWCDPLDAQGALLPDGRYCLPSYAAEARGFVCIDPKTQPPTLSELLDLMTLEADLGIHDSDAVEATGYPEVLDRASWVLRAPVATPDGRVFFLATRLWQTSGTSPLGWSVDVIGERLPDGTVRARFGPIPSPPFQPAELGLPWSPWGSAQTLLFDPGLDAILAWPVDGQEFNLGTESLVGPFGRGFRVLPRAELGLGYLALSAPLMRAADCPIPTLPGGGKLIPAPGQCQYQAQPFPFIRANGKLAFVISDDQGQHMYDLGYDRDTLDLDDDGLPAAEEAALGSSDLLYDSDFGRRLDGDEALLAGTDPTDPEDDQASAPHERVRERIEYVTSTLFRGRLPAMAPDNNGIAATAGSSGPLCVEGTCYGSDGGVVLRYPFPPPDYQRAVTSVDGTFIAVFTTSGVERIFFADGRRDLLIAKSELDALLPVPHAWLRQVIPVSPELTWIAVDDIAQTPDTSPARIAVIRPGEQTIVYDHAQAQRDSGLEVATSNALPLVESRVESTLTILGYNSETAMLAFGVRGTWDTWLVGLRPDGTRLVLARGRRLAGLNQLGWRGWKGATVLAPPLPDLMHPTGHGDYFTAMGVMDPFGLFVPTSVDYYRGAFVDEDPITVWGDTLLYNINQAGTFELVRHDHAIAPGDALVMLQLPDVGGARFPGAPRMLFRSGPRGGLSPLWSEGERDIQEATGMDMVRDGTHRLCVADALAGVVWELSPVGDDGPPVQEGNAADVTGIVDCAYDEDGALHVLAQDPPRLLMRQGPFDDLVVERTLDATARPLELLHAPDGTLEVFDDTDPARGKAYLADGRIVTMNKTDFTLRIDGVALADMPRLMWINDFSDVSADTPARLDIAVRPDGLIMVAPHSSGGSGGFAAMNTEVQLVDPRSGQVMSVDGSHYYATLATAMTVVPGGVGGDPWTGRVGGAPIMLPPGVDPPAIPAAPSGGTVVESSDCAGASGTSLVPTLLALAVLALGHRRRVRRERR